MDTRLGRILESIYYHLRCISSHHVGLWGCCIACFVSCLHRRRKWQGNHSNPTIHRLLGLHVHTKSITVTHYVYTFITTYMYIWFCMNWWRVWIVCEHAAAINGGWSDWSDCPVTCGGDASTKQSRQCNNPVASNGGSKCTADGSKSTQLCGQDACPCKEKCIGALHIYVLNSIAPWSEYISIKLV